MAGLPYKQIEQALTLLNNRLELAGSPSFSLVVCGGSALLALGIVTRTTRDVDVVALWDEEEVLAAARWSMTHDVSEGYRWSLEHFLRWFGRGYLVERL